MDGTHVAFGVHSAIFINAETNVPIVKTDKVTQIGVTINNEMIEHIVGNRKRSITHYQGRGSIEPQVTFKEFVPELYQIALGGDLTNLDRSSNNFDILKVGGSAVATYFTIAAVAAKTLVEGRYVLARGAANWNLYGINPERAPESGNSNTEIATGLAIKADSTTELTGLGVNVQLSAGATAASYTGNAGDYIEFQIVDKDKKKTTQNFSLNDLSRVPFVRGVFGCEKQVSSDQLILEVPRMRCSAGFPFNFQENTINEFQLTFMASALNPGDTIFSLTQDHDV